MTTSISDHAIQTLALTPSSRPMRVLAAEDNPVFQSMLKTMLTKWGYQAVIARSGTEAWRVLESEDAPRLAILDWMMPGMDGLEICRRIRSANREPYIYILLLTARTESQDLIEGMDAGADDYLTKPFNAHELRVRLHAGRRILDLQEELLKAREALREQATHDGLTGLLNRTGILEKLDDELSRASRTGTPVSVLMADLDLFKSINDTRGHLSGDAVLREAACRLKAAARRYDSVGRYGGEEFLLCSPAATRPMPPYKANAYARPSARPPSWLPASRSQSPRPWASPALLTALPKPSSAKLTTPFIWPKRRAATASWCIAPNCREARRASPPWRLWS